MIIFLLLSYDALLSTHLYPHAVNSVGLQEEKEEEEGKKYVKAYLFAASN